MADEEWILWLRCKLVTPCGIELWKDHLTKHSNTEELEEVPSKIRCEEEPVYNHYS
jgi:hypothetical protein